MKTIALLFAFGAAALATGAYAQGQAGVESAPPLAQPQQQNDIAYLCGGIGDREIDYMKQQARDYDLMLTFATREGAYLANVDVDIKDANGGQVLQVACDGPILLVDLPRAGTYRVRADAAGYTLNRTVRVAAPRNARRVASTVMAWPQQASENSGAASSSIGGSGGGNGSGAKSGSGSR